MLLRRLFTISFLVFAFLIIAAPVSAQGPSSVNWQSRPAKELAPGYLLRIRSVDDKDLNGEFRIDFDGSVTLPYGVRVDTTGMTLTDLQSRLIGEYRQYFKTTPSLDISVGEKRYWVDVRGLVQNAGKYLVSEKSSLDEIIAKAGALRTGEGQQAEFVKIEQLGVNATLKLSDYYRGLADEIIPQWQGGEIIFFQSEGIAGVPVSPIAEGTIQLLGQVTVPGEYRVKPGADFLYYMVKAGGPTDRADTDKIEIIRIVDGKRTNIEFELEDVRNLPQIESGDVVLVHAYRESRGIVNFTSILTAITSVALLFLI
jgi:protein involved in polysaccharide export with SLBB domain